MNYALADGSNHASLLTYDGTNFQTVASSDDIAPGSGGLAFGLGLQAGGINDRGDISFTAVPAGVPTFYVIPSGGTVVRVAGTSDVPPPECTWCTVPGGTTPVISPFLVPSPPPINALGEILISFAGGLFVGSKSGLTLVPVASSGLCGPPVVSGGTFFGGTPVSSVLVAGLPNASLNNSGAVAFTDPTASATAICLVPPGGGPPVAQLATGGSGPASIGAGMFTTVSFVAMDGSGDILFEAAISGGNTPYALLRFHSSTQQMEAVAYNGEALSSPAGASIASPFVITEVGPQTETLAFPGFSAVSMSDDGRVSFRATLTQGGTAIYQQTAANAPALIALDAQPSPLPGGAAYELIFTTQTKTLDNGSTYFPAYVANASADFGEFLGAPGNVQPLMSTADTLPTGARTTFVTAAPKIAGHYVVFLAQPAGGRLNLLESDLSAGTTTLIANNGQIEASGSGALPEFATVSPAFFVNENGEVAFEVLTGNLGLLSGTGVIQIGSGIFNSAWSSLRSQCGAVYLWAPSAGLSKVAAPGDSAPVPGANFTCAALNSTPPSPLNGSGQVAFSASYSRSSSGNAVFGNGTFLYSPGGAVSEIVSTTDTLPGESLPTTLVPTISVAENSQSQTAFGAQVGTPPSGFFGGAPSGFQGFFLRTGSGTPQKIIASGDPVPGTSDTFGAPHYISGLDDNGDLAFSASAGASVDGVFFAPAKGSIQTIAVDGAAVPGTGGGAFSLGLPPIVSPPGTTLVVVNPLGEIALMNGESDIAFRAGIIGGSANSGYFRMLQSGSTVATLQPVAVQGQAAPGGGTFTSILAPNPQGPYFSLGPDGALAFLNEIFNNGVTRVGIFVSRRDGTLLKIMASGDPAPGGGVVRALGMSYGLAAGDTGKFVFLAAFAGGSANEGIYVTSIPSSIAATTTVLGSSQSSSKFGQQITLTATVSSSGPGTVTGNVNFVGDGVLLGTSALAGGQAPLNVSTLSGGSHSIVAYYIGDANFAPSNSASRTEDVSPRTTATALTSSLNPAVGGQSITFTATVTTSAGSAPTGTITFLDGATVLGTGALNGGTAALTTTSLSVTSHSIAASYGGDANSATSTSAVITQAVSIANIVSPTTLLTVAAGQNLTIPLTVFAMQGSNLTFTLSCSGLPAGASCVFASNPVSAAPPPNGTNVQLTFSTTKRSGTVLGGPRRGPFPVRGFLLATLLAAFVTGALMPWGKARQWRLVSCACLAMFALALAMGGCGAAGYSSSAPATSGTPAGLAAFTVSGTSGDTMISAVVKVDVL